jgi:putative oxidoreductase
MIHRVVARVYPPFVAGRGAFGLALMRAVAGAAMMFHGWGKIQNPFHWMDKASSPAPAVFQALAAISEFLGGFAIAIGLLTPLAAFGIACTMLVALSTHLTRGDSFVGKGGSYEPALGYLALMALLILIGPGTLSVDAVVLRRWIPSRPTPTES